MHRWLLPFLLTGCLDLDASKPECFPDEGCPGGQTCHAGACVAAATLPMEWDCGEPCGALLGALGSGPGTACLFVDERPSSLDASALDAARVPAGSSTVSLLLYAEPDAERCAEATDTCSAESGCLARVEGAIGEEAVVLDCQLTWAETPAETCDGVDEDCDGSVDEGLGGAACAEGVGVCGFEGLTACVEGALVCEGELGEPALEVRNELDDDCDGQVDEATGCPCGTDEGICEQGLRDCDDAQAACLDPEGNAVILPGEEPEFCNALDDDCDGRVDEGFDPAPGDECSAGLGACAAMGVVSCVAGEAVCDAVPVAAGAEVCSGADEDCDGAVDEDFELGVACELTLGGCSSAGETICGDAGDVACDAPPPMAREETCEGTDEDCDGEIDESFADLASVCAEGFGICRAQGSVVCDPADPSRAICDASPGPAAVETCNTRDDDCDDAVDEDFDLQTDLLHCGQCDNLCELPNAVAECAGGLCRIQRCQDGVFVDLDGDPTNGCECDQLAEDEPDPDFVDSDCDGVDGTSLRAVFVSLAGDDEQGLGSAEAPYRSLARGMVLADSLGVALYVATGEHVLGPRPLDVSVSIFGGYVHEPDTHRWRRVGPEQASTVLLGGEVALRVRSPARPIVLSHLEVRAADSEGASSSVALHAEDVGDRLELRRTVLRAGDAGAGQPAEPGLDSRARGVDGLDGFDGEDPDCPGCGGDGRGNGACGDARGGPGGLGRDNAGIVGQVGAGEGGGEAGTAGRLGEDGGGGGEGRAGEHGAVGAPQPLGGRLDAEGVWRPTWTPAGEDGSVGAPGGGGGGGGGTLRSRGGGGGGGGSAGCPGTAAGGALAGAGSIALQLRGGQVRLLESRLISGAGGAGGAGGRGGLGGSAGQGGAPGVGACMDCGNGGRGGPGGRGGCGGHSAGAMGGPSLPVLLVDPQNSGVEVLDLEGPAAPEAWLEPGLGGAGGAAASRDACGPDSEAGEVGPAMGLACCTLDGGEGCLSLGPCR